jgi:Zn-dependent protease
MPTHRGSIRLFRLAGIQVFLHWSWFLVAMIEIDSRRGTYSSVVWNVLEYLALFLIVTMHEFGHSLACRQVGGVANQIVLWPLGGVAYVDPPQRPGATLWSIVAGPLVNVLLLPVFYGLLLGAGQMGWAQTFPDAYHLLDAVLWIDIGLFVFNILPIYPLDGGQILRSLLWFVVGRARSLMVAAVTGLVGMIGFVALALWIHSWWLAIIAGFILLNCWSGLQQARALLRIAKAPQRHGFACPVCRNPPPVGDFWRCGQCRRPFDTFEREAVCPHCGARFGATRCLECGSMGSMREWSGVVLPAESKA